MTTRAAAAIGVLMLAACDLGGREAAELREELAAKRAAVSELEREVARLAAELTREREQRAHDAAARAAECATPSPVALSFPPPGDVSGLSSIACAENRCTVPRRTFDALLADPALFAKGARVVPSMRDGKVEGFKVYAIRSGGVYHALGLKNGDRITALGEFPLTSVDAALTAYLKLRTASEWTISGERQGAPFVLTVALGE